MCINYNLLEKIVKVINYLERVFIMKRIIKILFVLSFMCGIVFLSVGGWMYYEKEELEAKSIERAEKVIGEFEKRYSTKDKDNETDVKNISYGKYSPELKNEFDPQFNDAIGILELPQIDGYLPIVEGTNEDDLKKGVGHYSGTGFPLDDEQIMLSGHRDTVFRRLGELKVGDVLTVKMPYGSFDYEIVNTKIVGANDRTIIIPHDEETLTVSTCYPFTYIGSAPDRYIIDAKPVK